MRARNVICMPKVKAPIVDAEVDPSDPAGSGKSVVMATAGFVLALGIAGMAHQIYNEIARRTPDQIREVEVI